MRMQEAHEALKAGRDRKSPPPGVALAYETFGKMASVMPLLVIAPFFLNPPLFVSTFLMPRR